MTIPTFEQIEALVSATGRSDFPYLRHHYPRFRYTKAEFDRGWRRSGPREVVLDVGAHWLHQSLLYALDDYEVIATDLPTTLEDDAVKQLAGQTGIRLLPNADLERPAPALASLPDNSVSIVLFTEILEHITFNPVEMWREIYRVLRPRGRIIVTTPNFYAWRGRCWEFGRFFKRFGAGLSAYEIVNTPTFGHHWKEYSLREIIYYFCILSPDFNVTKALHVPEYAKGYLGVPDTAISKLVEKAVRILRPNVHLEVEIREKNAGITAKPAW
ncbi:MAG TPA: methyltransferase domain-containing protein [Tahibacter sp.]|nr:methyltransferase domain-containing protein [Tahibacter sp.]